MLVKVMFKPTALLTSSGPTISMRNAWRAGLSKASIAPRQKREDKHHPNFDGVREHEEAQRKGQQCLNGLGEEQEPSFVGAIRDQASNWAQDQHGKKLRCDHGSDCEATGGQVED